MRLYPYEDRVEHRGKVSLFLHTDRAIKGDVFFSFNFSALDHEGQPVEDTAGGIDIHKFTKSEGIRNYGFYDLIETQELINKCLVDSHALWLLCEVHIFSSLVTSLDDVNDAKPGPLRSLSQRIYPEEAETSRKKSESNKIGLVDDSVAAKPITFTEVSHSATLSPTTSVAAALNLTADEILTDSKILPIPEKRPEPFFETVNRQSEAEPALPQYGLAKASNLAEMKAGDSDLLDAFKNLSNSRIFVSSKPNVASELQRSTALEPLNMSIQYRSDMVGHAKQDAVNRISNHDCLTRGPKTMNQGLNKLYPGLTEYTSAFNLTKIPEVSQFPTYLSKGTTFVSGTQLPTKSAFSPLGFKSEIKLPQSLGVTASNQIHSSFTPGNYVSGEPIFASSPKAGSPQFPQGGSFLGSRSGLSLCQSSDTHLVGSPLSSTSSTIACSPGFHYRSYFDGGQSLPTLEGRRRILTQVNVQPAQNYCPKDTSFNIQREKNNFTMKLPVEPSLQNKVAPLSHPVTQKSPFNIPPSYIIRSQLQKSVPIQQHNPINKIYSRNY